MEQNLSNQSADSSEKKSELPRWSNIETEWLRYEQFKAEVAKVRGGGPESKPGWQKFMESTGGAALITVLIGGIIGQIISMTIQSRLARNNQALVAYTKFLEQGADTVEKVYGLIGKCISSSEVLIAAKDLKFDNATVQKKEFEATYESIGDQWSNEKLQLGLKLRYYHHNDEKLTSAWIAVADKTTAYMNCAGDFYNAEGSRPPACEAEKKAVFDALDVLTTRRLEVSSQYELKTMDDPGS